MRSHTINFLLPYRMQLTLETFEWVPGIFHLGNKGFFAAQTLVMKGEIIFSACACEVFSPLDYHAGALLNSSFNITSVTGPLGDKDS